MNRNLVIDEIEKGTEWDIVVIGGGSTGLGTALEAATRGYKVLLVEQSDFAKSTSGKSTKLIHGGVRYLAQGNIRLVREANVERGLLIKNAPHLVNDQQFIIPVYSQWERLKYLAGLKLYDWIAGWSSLGSTRFVKASEVVKAMPGLKPDGLIGGVLYHDGRFDDARFALELARNVFIHGGFAINYFKVENLNKKSGKISGIKGKDILSGKSYDIRAKAVVNATGVFADEVLKMDEPSSKNTLSVSQGIHLVFDKEIFESTDALMIPKTKDGRVLFVIPWHDKVLVGTTDMPVERASLEPIASDNEINFILDTLHQYLNIKVDRSNIKSVFAGLRPLAASGAKSTKEISRGHRIMRSTSGLYSIIGGKWTTYRKMGEDVISTIEQTSHYQQTVSITSKLKLDSFGQLRSVFLTSNLPSSSVDEIISVACDLYKSAVKKFIIHEMALTVDDVLSRRTRILLLDAEEALRIAPKVAKIMAIEFNENNEWINNQVDEFTAIAKNYLISK
ncbi:MAG: glycerol-3-phosphate dehydrogenase/oxidase [Ginsengibacter sp.]